MKLSMLCGSIVCAFAIASSGFAADWRGFLGGDSTAYNPSAKVPTEIAVASADKPAKNIAWKTELAGRSVSGPIVVGNRVFTTGSSGLEGRWCETTCVDAQSGKVLWSRKIRATGRPFCHPTSANAAPTPCTDGQFVYAFFSSNDLVCYDLDGNLIWCRGLSYDHPKAGNDVGMSSSPTLAGGVLVVQIECQADSFAAGIDAKTGATMWQIERPHEANWSSPRTITGADGQQVVLMQSSQGLVAIDPRSGSEAWKIEQKCSTVPSSTTKGSTFFVPSGSLKAYDLPKGLEAPKLLWEASRLIPDNASSVATDKQLLSVKGSVLIAADTEGKVAWQIRLGEVGQVWASPVVAGDTMVVLSMNGKYITVDLSGAEGKVLGTSELGEQVLGSPALAGNALYVRSVGALWKLQAN